MHDGDGEGEGAQHAKQILDNTNEDEGEPGKVTWQ